MATSSPLKDIDDKFCLCSICLDQLKEPKLMPCLHRYCKDCLSSIIEGSDGLIKCPECREEIQVPTNGVDGFKTDFYSKGLAEYVQIQQLLKHDEVRECYSCSKHVTVAAYCFKCNDFLCVDCHSFHVRNRTLKDHRQHTLSIEDIEQKNITIEKLASMRDAPRCHIHPEKVSELYCQTCSNSPVCMVCTYGEHKGHDLDEVKAMAKCKRKELAKILEEIGKEHSFSTLVQAKEKLRVNVKREREEVIKMHDKKDEEIKREIKYIEGKKEEVKQEKKKKEKEIIVSVEKEMEHEIARIQKKYGEIIEVKKTELMETYKAIESSLGNELDKLHEKREHFHQGKSELLQEIEKQWNGNVESIEEMSEHIDNLTKRFEMLDVMASSIISSENDWSVVQCTPDISTSANNLMEDLKRDIGELKTFTEVAVNYNRYFLERPSVIKISDEYERKVYRNDPYWCVGGMTSSGDGNIVITGVTSDSQELLIILMDSDGKILKEKKLNKGDGCMLLAQDCKLLSQHKVVSVCLPNEIGLYDVYEESYIVKNISDVTNSWSKELRVSCIATDPVNCHILIGQCHSRDVYIFDDELNYLHILKLPEMMKYPVDMTVSDGHLLVCGHDTKNCHITYMDVLDSKLVGEFVKPELVGDSCGLPCPRSICTDKNYSVYLLWETCDSARKCYVVQYTQDGGEVLTEREVGKGAAVISVIDTSHGEKLVVTMYSTQTLYLYDIITEW